ncbi:hypothetical protein SAMN02799630_02049 [Paenibacillus sp. UNCCL117]|uniref:hypothetical protein n=1 Tax=unclassified Paenibacillus TaxID=185978 RepID=UPI0008849EEB|nr:MULTISPECIES: hypothetical protein [unclassified Paenibacillus]SDD02732.1 hypothetical protein SAMN04488602_10578 [Paenibacillus sp. cl123]SFW32436.1 hypothetical protein SAMN02799630_02049 [Paenibacillus sp. UNCCL117]
MLIENATGRQVPVTVTRMQLRDIQEMRPGWTPGFNWRLYFKYPAVEVYKIMVTGSNRIEGALALEYQGDHVWIHLIEKSPFNRGAAEQYKYVAHHLFAFAAKRSQELGAEGFIAFDAKTGLMEHYQQEYGAIAVGRTRMFIPDVAGQRLIDVYLT